MNLIKILLSIVTIIFFISCGENTTKTVTSDIKELNIDPDDDGYKVHSTSMLELSATITYQDGNYGDATNSISWKLYNRDDYNIINLDANIVYPVLNSGRVTVNAIYKDLADFNDSVSIEIIPLVDFYIVPFDANTTGTHILKAKGNFEDGVNKKVTYNISWSSSEDDDEIVFENNIATIDIDGTGKRTITASIFSGTDDENNQTITYLIK